MNTSGFRMFSGGLEKEQWHEIGTSKLQRRN